MMKVPHLIASMIDFYYRNRNSHKIFKRKVRFNAFCLDEEEKFTYMKNHIVETIKDRKYGYIRDNDLLLTSELGNLQDAIAEAKESYKIVAPIIYQHIREARVDSENDPDVEEHIGAYYDDIENLRYEITSRQDKLDREVAKREGKLAEYRAKIEQEWDDECHYTYMRESVYLK